MGRLSRAQLQERNRAKVLAAARAEFAERGFPGAKVDGIAGRAGLTRGAVYSNFPGKRALYFAVLADLAEQRAAAAEYAGRDGRARRAALGAFARAWVARLPLTGERDGAELTGEREGARLGTPVMSDLMSEILAEERTRRPFAQLMKVNALLLGLALEQLRGTPGRLVQVAESVLTTLHGARQLADAAPGFIEPFTVIGACERLAELDVDYGGDGDETSGSGAVWAPPHLPYVAKARPVDDAWSPPAATGAAGVPWVDAVGGGPARLDGDGVVAILGLHRLEAAEEAVRAAPDGATVTAVLVTSDPGELMPLARLVVADLIGCLRQAFPESSRPRLQIVYDGSGVVAEAAGVTAVSDGTEAAVRIRAGRIVARADGRGACYAAAHAGVAPVGEPGGKPYQSAP